ncbi:hypothetical protein LEP1GSC016_1799 [Leptospira borgpetersenii serovar Hardjo-bovis str. Sponselee]|uniref:Uncharacterized protein n=1 Tax=Leptospira borgpetersenii serovar Hardjo-bovis str. Sponselee TaxID=1303729 RepID=M6C5X2_LEPBO|nr:hypothetical protein LBK6_00255 [Leptospira borgpetersenii serovar Hardjo]EMJ81645.1 hypothetical protein LEP1GSC016_1799 [Leptospira borgpetersenii serovar Hardjo-bovis str. Sponselee]AMX60118.1 hypothetical protein LBK9_00255 [Leptospira borgpetersenii serovar Hardjo]AMX63365.1 hypothetical protein LBK30_00255 [Leptospira borgpetersenii serovar Hardjo]AMX66605.1 hypothetical protein LBHA_00260 [Leptospira borgpetersenii serovar Hardjo]
MKRIEGDFCFPKVPTDFRFKSNSGKEICEQNSDKVSTCSLDCSPKKTKVIWKFSFKTHRTSGRS